MSPVSCAGASRRAQQALSALRQEEGRHRLIKRRIEVVENCVDPTEIGGHLSESVVERGQRGARFTLDHVEVATQVRDVMAGGLVLFPNTPLPRGIQRGMSPIRQEAIDAYACAAADRAVHAVGQLVHPSDSRARTRQTKVAYGPSSVVIDEALCFGWIDGQIGRRDEASYRQRFTPRRPRSAWSVRNVENVARLSEAGRMQPAGRAAVDAAKADGRWHAAYASQANAQIPPDLSEALAANPAAMATFDQLDSANRYATIYRLNAVKLPQTPTRKLSEYIDMLSRGDAIHQRKPRKYRS